MSFGGFTQENTTPMSEINTTPLVDVMLVLLVVFIVTAPLLTHAIPIALPQEVAAEHQDKPDAAQLAISEKGEVYLNDQPISVEQLERHLQQAKLQNPKIEVHVRADKNVVYEHVAAVMAATQRAGIENLGFVTEAPNP